MKAVQAITALAVLTTTTATSFKQLSIYNDCMKGSRVFCLGIKKDDKTGQFAGRIAKRESCFRRHDCHLLVAVYLRRDHIDWIACITTEESSPVGQVSVIIGREVVQVFEEATEVIKLKALLLKKQTEAKMTTAIIDAEGNVHEIDEGVFGDSVGDNPAFEFEGVSFMSNSSLFESKDDWQERVIFYNVFKFSSPFFFKALNLANDSLSLNVQSISQSNETLEILRMMPNKLFEPTSTFKFAKNKVKDKNALNERLDKLTIMEWFIIVAPILSVAVILFVCILFLTKPTDVKNRRKR